MIKLYDFRCALFAKRREVMVTLQCSSTGPIRHK